MKKESVNTYNYYKTVKYNFKEFQFEESSTRVMCDKLMHIFKQLATLSLFWVELTTLGDDEDPRALYFITKNAFEDIDFTVIENINLDIYFLQDTKDSFSKGKRLIENKLEKISNKKSLKGLIKFDDIRIFDNLYADLESLMCFIFFNLSTNDSSRFNDFREKGYKNLELEIFENIEIGKIYKEVLLDDSKEWVKEYEFKEARKDVFVEEVNLNYKKTGVLQTNTWIDINKKWKEIKQYDFNKDPSIVLDLYKEIEHYFEKALQEDYWTAQGQKEATEDMLNTVRQSIIDVTTIKHYKESNFKTSYIFVACFLTFFIYMLLN